MRIARIDIATNVVTEVLQVSSIRVVSPAEGEILLAVDTQLNLKGIADSVILIMVYDPETRRLFIPTQVATAAELLYSVVDLKLTDYDLGVTAYTGSSPKFTWQAPAIVTTPGFNDLSWLQKYKVEIINPNLTVRRTDYVTVNSYEYSYELNSSDGSSAAREFTIKVTAIDMLDRPFVPSSITVNNTAPSVLVVTTNPSLLAFTTSYPLLEETDVAGYRVHGMSSASCGGDFVPSADNLIYQGMNNSYTHWVTAAEAWIVYAAAYDSFGYDSLNFDTKETVTPISVVDDVANGLVGSALETTINSLVPDAIGDIDAALDTINGTVI